MQGVSGDKEGYAESGGEWTDLFVKEEAASLLFGRRVLLGGEQGLRILRDSLTAAARGRLLAAAQRQEKRQDAETQPRHRGQDEE